MKSHWLVPFVSVDVRPEDIFAVASVLRSGYLNEGPVVKEFETAFAEYTGAKHAIACTSGTAAIFLAVRAWLDLRDNHVNVWIPDRTFYGTASAVNLAGGNIRLYDDKPARYSGYAELCIATHMSGRFCLPSTELPMIEDCAHALGCFKDGKHAGTFGLAGCFSFQAEKLIGIGQGGMVITNDDRMAERIYQIKNQGRKSPKSSEGGDKHPSLGYNFRITDYQAALGLGQLLRLKEKISEKWEAWNTWGPFELRNRQPGEIPLWTDILFHSRESRDRALSNVRAIGIEARRHYEPIHIQHPFEHYSCPFPSSTEASNCELWLPNNRFVTPGIARKVAEIILREMD